jgi:hypothetical protein
MKKLSLFSILILLFFLAGSPALAAKKRVAKTTVKRTTNAATSTQGVKAWVRLRADRQALLIDFSGFNNLKSGSYELTYNANGIPQGVSGTIILNDTSTKTLLFGTCSAGVCSYHRHITNARLKITSFLNSGQKVIKIYRLKV